MIRIENLKKSYGPQLLFDGVSFSLQSGERLGIVGRNGHGKSTLFKILIGEEHQDSGEIFIPKNYKIGHLSQHLVFTHPTILEEVVSALPELEGGWKEEYKAEAILLGLGFHQQDFIKAPAAFSGGFQIRLNLAKLLLTEPNLLLLDEPTNYLDIVAVRWITTFLREWQGEMMLITHDREFMDSVTTHTMAIHRQKAKKLQGTTEKLYTQILQEEEIHEKTRQNQQKQRKEVEKFIARFRAQASKAASVQSRVKKLEKMEVKSELSDIDSLDFHFTPAAFPGKFLADLDGVGFGYQPENPLFSNVTISIAKQDRIAVIGPNGKGKTTLLSLIAAEMAQKEGVLNFNPNTKVAYFGQTNVNRLPLDATIEDELIHTHSEHNRTVARTIAGLMMFEGDFALKKIRYLSGGERSRVLLGKILLTPCNLLLLDEPTNHLDMESIQALLEAIDEFPGAVIIVSHSEEILRKVANRLIIFDRGKASVFEGTYDEFLERIGWSDEDEDPSVVKKRKPAAEAIKANAKEIQKREKAIMKLEQELSELNKDLEQAVQDSENKSVLATSKVIAEKNSEIEKLMDEMIQLERN